ncbi:hypothetical protein [Anaerostipes sp. Marseille-Q3525]|uniref:hypothetical protein n=1 Tax=Anaerostipes sp. Marseille-Q3525 TaxID=2758418 RepID=UPI001BAC6967|nr:hypothetical protein [Anaerostipes sp. Marseille-Q3525]MBR9962276.1 hypothetical protein [Anaerostipes sp. Marseille-Q3525]
MRQKYIDLAIHKLAVAFASLDLTFHPMNTGVPGDITSYWPGSDDEDILICVFKGNQIHEPFHRQDFFFREYLPTIYTDSALFRFFVEPQTNKFSEEYIHLPVTKDYAILTILELMIVEYADKKEDTQKILKSMLQTLLLQIARRYRIENSESDTKPLARQIIDYMDDHSDVVTLKDIAAHFSYHPNYISSLLHKETERAFTEIPKYSFILLFSIFCFIYLYTKRHNI